MSGEVLKMRLEDPANIALLENVLKQVMGRDIFVQVVLSSATKSTHQRWIMMGWLRQRYATWVVRS